MLTELSIRDIALISRLRVSFAPGLNVLSGETGAGKSLIVGGLRLLCGEKPAPDTVREGAERGFVEGVFELDPAGWIARELEEIGIPLDDGTLVLVREISASGKGRIRANGATLARAALERAASLLVDLHGQHDHQLLLRPSEQLAALDDAAGLSEAREAFASAFDSWRAARTARVERDAGTRDAVERRDLQRFQLQELESAALRPGEPAALDAERRRLEAAELLRTAAETIADRLLEAEDSVHDTVADLGVRAEEASARDPSWAGVAESLEALRIQAQEVGREARDRSRAVVDDPERLELVRARLRRIADLLRKYGPDEAALFDRWERLRAEPLDADAAARDLTALREREREFSAILARSGAELTRKRKARARSLARAIEASLEHLGLARARFEVQVAPRESGEALDDEPGSPRAGSSGLDAVELLFSANAGESPRPLNRVASGGELSRVMLALKSHLGRKRGTATMIFDEIDHGVGGVVASRIGEALAALARERQVLCITHLAQVASRAERHLRVAKAKDGARTVTTVEPVESEDRVREIARMLGSAAPEGIAVEHARELLRGGAR